MKLGEIYSKLRVWGVAGAVNYALRLLNNRKHAKRLRELALKSKTTPEHGGVTVIGDLTGRVSLSKTLRDFILSLKDAGIPCQSYDTTRKVEIPSADAENIVTPPDEFDIKKYDLIVLMYRAPIDKRLLPGIRVARIAFHESEHGARVTMPFLHESGDDIIAMSDFNYNYFMRDYPSQRVYKVTYPLRLPGMRTNVFNTLVLGNDETNTGRFTVFFNFDFGSYYRKNVEAAIEAFYLAFKDEPSARLVFKTKGAKQNPREVKAMMRKVRERGLEDRFEHIASYISREALDRLAAETDVYLSLHHAEGFGLGMAEAMASCVPVVATDWSANTEFCNAENSWPVPVKMTPILPHEYPAVMKEWSAPDVEAAAKALREIFENRELAAKKALLAREQLVERYSLANFKRDMEALMKGDADRD